MLKIQFVLPGVSKRPVGGYKIVFEYANRLTATGKYRCTILFVCGNTLQRFLIPDKVRSVLVRGLVRYFPKWFTLDKRVKKKAIFKWIDDEVPDADVIVATSYITVPLVQNLSDSKGKKFYFIQGYETWDGKSGEYIHQTYSLGMKNIVVSGWLKRIVDRYGKLPSELIPNAIDFGSFGVDVAPKDRNTRSVAMLYSANPVKGCKDGLKALEILRSRFPDLEAHLFGVGKPPKDLPKWIRYTRNASKKKLRQIYNNAAVFLSTSVSDGFGLCGAESMACGCALVSTDYDGAKEYAVDGENALLCEKGNATDIANKAEKLFTDEKLRIHLAEKGTISIHKLSWDTSVAKFDRCIREVLKTDSLI